MRLGPQLAAAAAVGLATAAVVVVVVVVVVDGEDLSGVLWQCVELLGVATLGDDLVHGVHHHHARAGAEITAGPHLAVEVVNLPQLAVHLQQNIFMVHIQIFLSPIKSTHVVELRVCGVVAVITRVWVNPRGRPRRGGGGGEGAGAGHFAGHCRLPRLLRSETCHFTHFIEARIRARGSAERHSNVPAHSSNTRGMK